MPIEVRHDVPIAASAGLAALAGTAQTQIKERDEQRARGRIAMQLGAQADRQHESIQARVEAQQQQIEAASAQAHQQAEYAKDQLGLRAGLQEELQDQKNAQEIERMKSEAQTQAEQFEWKLDVTAKKRQNQHRRELAWLRSPEAREHYEEDEIRLMEGETMRSLLNPQKTPYEPEPKWDDSIPDKFKGGMPGELPDGTYGYFTPNRTTNVAEFHQLDPSKTMAGIELKGRMEEEKEQRTIDQKRREQRETERIKLMTEKFQPTQEAKIVAWGRDIKAGPVGPERLRTREEADKILDAMLGPDPDVVPRSILDSAEVSESPSSLPQEVPEILISSAKSENVSLTAAEKGLPASVAWAQAYMRAIMLRTDEGERIPSYLQEAVRVSEEILHNYRVQGGL